MMDNQALTVGKIVNTHGIRGELKVVPSTDFPEERFKQGSTLLVIHPEQQSSHEITIQSSRYHKGMYIVKLQGMDNINDVQSFKGALLKVPKEQLQNLSDDEYYYYEIVGCTVITDEGVQLGKITEILSPGANDVWVVDRGAGKPVLLPVIDDVILDVDVENKQVKVHLLEGLIDE